jgi:hypothetical protein
VSTATKIEKLSERRLVGHVHSFACIFTPTDVFYAMPFTVTHSLGRLPTFPELQELAKQHEVQINGNEMGGDFCHPDKDHPKVEGNYAFEKNGDICGDFTGHVIGKLTGIFKFMTGKAEITITEKPFLLPEAVLRSKLSDELKEFCAKFPPVA